MAELPSAASGKKRYSNRRFMGKPHQVRVSKNPLHYTSKLESLRECWGCGELLHKDAFLRNGVRLTRCPRCLKEMLG